MAAIVESVGAIAKVRDYSGGSFAIKDIADDISAFQPDYLVVSMTTPTLNADLDICNSIKRIFPTLRIIAKGAHFLNFGAATMEQCSGLDLIIRGEPEITLKEVIDGNPLDSIAGLVWRGKSGIVVNVDRQFIEDLDTLPFPARHLNDNNCYVRPDDGSVQAVIKVSRGCPYQCFFCLASPLSGRMVRRRSPENILSEIRQCVEKYNIRTFLFWSDLFTADKEWVKDLCDTIIRSNLDINWAANARADTVDLELVQLMRRAGCSLVSVGVESGSQEILNRSGKGIRLDRIREAFQLFRDVGMTTLAYYLLGLPWETRATAEETIRFSIELDSDFASFFVATPLPGTRFYDYAVEHRLFERQDGGGGKLLEGAYFAPAVKGHFLRRSDITELQRKALRRFYLRPKHIVRILRRIDSFKKLINYSRTGIALLR